MQSSPVPWQEGSKSARFSALADVRSSMLMQHGWKSPSSLSCCSGRSGVFIKNNSKRKGLNP